VDTTEIRKARRPLSLAEYEPLARARLQRPVWDFLAGGSGTESMVEANRAALANVWLRPRVLAGVTAASTATSLLGHALAAPLGVAPMAHHRLFHPEGEVATARAAGAAGALFVASIFASRTVEDIAAASSGPRWLQLYWLRNRPGLERLIRRAEDAGYGALVLTVDAPVVARRPRDIRNGFAVPALARAANLDSSTTDSSHRRTPGASAIELHSAEQFEPGLSWSHVAWLRAHTDLPLVLKGVLTAQDARLAVDHGVAAVVVSNHGGRQLEGAVPAVAALPEIAAVTRARCAVLVDGGFRRGSDVLKALALGADAVLIGRPVMWALTHAGSAGVTEALELLRVELAEAMLLSGLPELPMIDPGVVGLPMPSSGCTDPPRG
jgi:4-hydroxymandelate oxidase